MQNQHICDKCFFTFFRCYFSKFSCSKYLAHFCLYTGDPEELKISLKREGGFAMTSESKEKVEICCAENLSNNVVGSCCATSLEVKQEEK